MKLEYQDPIMEMANVSNEIEIGELKKEEIPQPKSKTAREIFKQNVKNQK